MAKNNFFLKIIIISCIIMDLSALTNVQAVILAAGQGSRFKTGITKLISPICGQPMAVYPVKLTQKLSLPTCVIIGYQKEAVKESILKTGVENIEFAEQTQQLGTGHALLACKHLWQKDTLLILNGDMPLITPDIIYQLEQLHRKNNAAISLVVSHNTDPANSFGRIVQNGNQIKIVEKKHFTQSIFDYPLVNAGIYLINRSFIEDYLPTITQNEQTHEFYLTDLVEIASKHNLPIALSEVNFNFVQGINTFKELADVEKIIHNQLIEYWMENGVRFIAPDTITIDKDVTIGKGSIISAGVQLLQGTKIGEFCTIEPHTVLKNCILESATQIGAHSILENVFVTEKKIIDPGTIKNSSHSIYNQQVKQNSRQI